MENVQFDETAQVNAMQRSKKLSGITKLFVALHLGKDEKQARTAMIVVIILCLLVAAYFIKKALSLGVF